MLNQIEVERIERYINGRAGKNDVIFVETLFSNGHDDPGLRSHLENDWESDHQTIKPSEEDLNHLLDRIHLIIRNKENQKGKLFIRRVTHIYNKLAAILLLPVIITGVLTSYFIKKSSVSLNEPLVKSVIHAPLGSRVSFNLPDGTVGWLNSGSDLTYSLPFNNNRKVTLIGEAWFDVAHNEKIPFQLNAGNSVIKVMGTSFDVTAYQGENYIEVVLQQGKVEFYNDHSSEKVIMLPSQKLVLRDGDINLSIIDPSKYKAWTEGKLIFRGDDMAEVARRIERWYNVKVILANKDLEKFSFRATFEDDSLEVVLRLLSMTSPIGYKIAPRTIKPDGTSEKEIVTLFKKTNKRSINQKLN